MFDELRIPNDLKVLSYWNLNEIKHFIDADGNELKVLSYWNLNPSMQFFLTHLVSLKYYHIGI